LRSKHTYLKLTKSSVYALECNCGLITAIECDSHVSHSFGVKIFE